MFAVQRKCSQAGLCHLLGQKCHTDTSFWIKQAASTDKHVICLSQSSRCMPIIVLLWKLAKNYYNLHCGFTNHLQHDPTVVQFFPRQAKPSGSDPSARRLRSEDRNTGHTSLNSRLPQKNTHCLSRHCHLF